MQAGEREGTSYDTSGAFTLYKGASWDSRFKNI
jgi:hypothetical protein